MLTFRELEDKGEDYLKILTWLKEEEIRKLYTKDDFSENFQLKDVKKKFRKKLFDEKLFANFIIINGFELGTIFNIIKILLMEKMSLELTFSLPKKLIEIKAVEARL